MPKDSFREGKWVFSLGPVSKKKKNAQKNADVMAKQGFRYRIRKVKGGWGVFVAGGRKSRRKR